MQETSKARQTRVEYIDIAKGLGILTIIWGHIHTSLSVTDCFCSQKGGHIFNGGKVPR